MSIFVGSGVAICTPFNKEGGFNAEIYDKLIEFHAKNGTDAIISCGTTGEAVTLSEEEQIEIVKTAVFSAEKYGNERGRKLPVVAGAGSCDTAKSIKMGKALSRAGADALMYVTPYYNKTSQAGLLEHYTAIAASVDLPVMVYNVPARTSLNILPKTMEKLAKIPNITAIKEASSNICQIAEMAERLEGNADIYSGNDDHIIPVLSLGGVGVVSTIANIIPKDVHTLVAKYMKGEHKEALKLQLGINPLVRLIFEDISPMPVKTALRLIGYDVGACRLPLTSISDDLRDRLKAGMQNYGIL